MGDIKDFQNEKAMKCVKNLRIEAEKIFGDDLKIELAQKRKDGFYKLAEKFLNIEDGKEFKWEINDGTCDLVMGTKRVWQFDANLIITASYGGGLEHIIWLHDHITTDDIYQSLLKTYDGFKFARFVK